MEHTSIIVYRNPLEAALWESVMVFPIMAGMLVALIAGLVVARLCVWLTDMYPKRFRNLRIDIITVVFAAISMLVTVLYLS